ncbi:MAG: hypothetical protein EOP10_33725 [Proteobacteria bacterium]|nr:MAG: hypothetical protein EOP10_33725 [Pseudomonadota bacterium]
MLAHFGVGTNKELPGQPGLRVELIPSADDISRGSVKFTSIDPSYFKVRPGSAVSGTHFLFCPDAACLNEGVSYRLSGNVIQIISKSAEMDKGGEATTSILSELSAEDLQ